MRYDTTKPRFTIFAPFNPEIVRARDSFETLNPNEVKFWLSLRVGYTSKEYHWNGKIFA